MIVLDTDVISEPMRQSPARAVLAWIAAQPAASFFTTALAQAEIFDGINLLPAAQRRDAPFKAARPIFETELAGRILPFDADAAMAYAEIVAEPRRLGRPISQADGQIAAIVRSRGAKLATRNLRDFDGCGIELVDPWTVL